MSASPDCRISAGGGADAVTRIMAQSQSERAAILYGKVDWESVMEYIVVRLITAVMLIALALLAAYSSVVARRPDAPSHFDPARYLGWLSCLCGIWAIFNGMLVLPAIWTTGAARAAALSGVMEVVLGLLIGYYGYALLTVRGKRARRIRLGLGYIAVVFVVFAVMFGVLAFLPGLLLVERS